MKLNPAIISTKASLHMQEQMRQLIISRCCSTGENGVQRRVTAARAHDQQQAPHSWSKAAAAISSRGMHACRACSTGESPVAAKVKCTHGPGDRARLELQQFTQQGHRVLQLTCMAQQEGIQNYCCLVSSGRA
jgi:hypothetical protein